MSLMGEVSQMLKIRVSDHAIARYRERIADVACAESEISDGAGRPLFARAIPRSHMLLGCVNCHGYPFMLLAKAEGEALVVLSAGPSFWWHECRSNWVRLVGLRAAKRGPDAIRKELIRRDYMRCADTLRRAI